MSENKVQIIVEVDAKTGQATIHQIGEEMEAAGKKGKQGFGQASTGAEGLDRSLAPVKTSARQAGVELEGAGRKGATGFASAALGADRLGGSLRPVIGMAGALGIAFGAAEIVQFGGRALQTADELRLLDQRLLLTAKTTGDYVAAQQSVVDISLASHQALGSTGTLYNRLAMATRNLDTTQAELADVSKAVALSVALSGSAAQESTAGMLQFAQAMGSGRLQGDELRSVMENMPVLAMILVDAVGGSMAEFRRMGEQNLLTTEFMVDALKKKLPELEAQAKGMPLTIGMALTDMRSQASLYVGEINQSTGATTGLATSIAWLGKNFEDVAGGGVVILTGGLSLLAVRGIASVATALPGMIASLRAAISVTETATVATNAYSLATVTTSRVSLAAAASRLLTMPNIIGAVTTVLSMGAAAWMLWGDKADAAGERVSRRLEELTRYNRMLKEMDDPGLVMREIAAEKVAAQAELDRIRQRSGKFDIDESGRIAVLQGRLQKLDESYRLAQANMANSAKQRAGKEMGAELSITDFEKKMAAERQLASASGLAKSLLEIGRHKDEALAAAAKQFKGKEEYARAEAAIVSRYAAEETKARADAGKKAVATGEKTGKALDAAMRGWEGKADLAGLSGVDEQLAKIGQEADELRRKYGNRPEIDAGQAKAENAAIQADFKKTTEQMAEARRVWEDKAELSGLTELDRKLKNIGQEAAKLRKDYGNQEWIDAGQAEAENSAIQLDRKKLLTEEQRDLLKITNEYHEAQLSGLPEEGAAIARLSDQYDVHRQAVVSWGEAQIAAGRDTAAVMAEIFPALDALDARQIESIEKIKNKSGALTEFQIQGYRNMQDAGAEFFASLRTGSDDWLENFSQMTLEMVDQWLAAQAMMAMFGEDFSKGGKMGGWLGTAASAIGAYFGSTGGITSAAAPGTSYVGSYDAMTGAQGAFSMGGGMDTYTGPSYLLAGGGRAAGGPVSAGKMYEVNERGIPELLSVGGRQFLMMGSDSGAVVPSTPSTFIPAAAPAPAPAEPTNINITIIAADAQSITDMMRRNPQAILGPLRDALQKGDRGLRGDLQKVM